jgi:hypothetical protein
VLKLAAIVLEDITQHPETHHQGAWMDGADVVRPGEPLPPDTTLCVAGHTAYRAGYTLSGGTAEKDGHLLSIHEAARLALGLSTSDASELFDPGLTPEQVRAVLNHLAVAGTAPIDWGVIHRL